MKPTHVTGELKIHMDDGRHLTLTLTTTVKDSIEWDELACLSFIQTIESTSPHLQGRRVVMKIEQLKQ